MPKKVVLLDLDNTLYPQSQYHPNADASKPFPQIPGFIDFLHTEGFSTGIVTNSARQAATKKLAELGLKIPVLWACGDEGLPKPNYKPIFEAVRKVNGRQQAQWTCFVGDTCTDIATARKTNVLSIAALWGAPLSQDTILAKPDYVCDTVDDLLALIRELNTSGVHSPFSRGGQVSQRLCTDARQRYENTIWQASVIVDGTERLPIRCARNRYPWAVWRTYAADIINAFKAPPGATNRQTFKAQAAKIFAEELALVLPSDARLLCIHPSKKRGDDGYDPRWDLLTLELTRLRPDVKVIEPIERVHSREAAHTQSDFGLRDPNNIVNDLRWRGNGISPSVHTIYVVDDVLTSGGHFKAYARMLREHHRTVEIIGLFWARHLSTPWPTSVDDFSVGWTAPPFDPSPPF